MPNLSWDNGRHRVCKWLEGKDVGAQSNIKQRSSLEEVRRVVVHNGEKYAMHQDVTLFERTQAYFEETVEYRADAGMWEDPISYLQHLHVSGSLDMNLLTGCLRPPGTCLHMQDQMEEKRGQRTATCANESLTRAQETWCIQQTGADGRSVRPNRRGEVHSA